MSSDGQTDLARRNFIRGAALAGVGMASTATMEAAGMGGGQREDPSHTAEIVKGRKDSSREACRSINHHEGHYCCGDRRPR